VGPWGVELDLGAVESFVVVTAHRHFGRAAAELAISVSAVTKRIQRLEADLGVPLIERDSGGFMGLTAAGQRFVQVAPELLRAVQTARFAAAGEPASTLRLAVPAGVGVVAPLLPATLATLELALRHTHPGVAVESVPTPFPRLTPDLLTSEVDLVLTFGASADERVESTRLSQIYRVGLVSARHPLGRRHSVGVEEFARLPMLYSPELPDEYMLPFVLADVRPLSEATLVPIDASNTAHVAQRILLGREVTVVPVALTANLPPELKRIGLTGVPPTHYFTHHRRDDRRPELLTAIDLMADFTDSISRAALAFDN
jgi:DNA-binding transcriptional LysR family regulator